MSRGNWFTVQHELHQILPDGFPLPERGWRSRADLTHVGVDGWSGYWPPEDHAVQPDFVWSESQRILVLDAFRRKWGQRLEPDQTYEIVWPPEASLWTEGHIYRGEPTDCVEHNDPRCEDCEYWNESVGDIEPAEWQWRVQIDTYRWYRGAGASDGFEWFEFMTTKMDPRDVDYEI